RKEGLLALLFLVLSPLSLVLFGLSLSLFCLLSRLNSLLSILFHSVLSVEVDSLSYNLNNHIQVSVDIPQDKTLSSSTNNFIVYACNCTLKSSTYYLVYQFSRSVHFLNVSLFHVY